MKLRNKTDKYLFEYEREDSPTHVAYKIGLLSNRFIFALIVEK